MTDRLFNVLFLCTGASAPEGPVVGEIGAELEIPPSTLSHHLDKLKNEDLLSARRASTFLRYTANTQTLQEIVGFPFAERCTRTRRSGPKRSLAPADRSANVQS